MKRTKEESRKRIHLRIKKRVSGTATKPRLSLYKSNKYIYCQLIDDVTGKVITAASNSNIDSTAKMTKIEQSKEVGKVLGEKARGVNIEELVFDRSGYLYHGRVKALADGIREAGIKF